MQFKYPEILYFLGLLIIPIIVHLFQLQRFVKVPFTNVAFLKKLVLQNRKSSRIKKWLILATRLLLLTAIIIAFAQPYFSNRAITEQSRFFIYLDNSLSTNTDGEKGNLLKVASQEIIENTKEKANYTLLTNDNFYRNKTSFELKDILLNLKNTAKSTNFKDVFLRIATEKNQTKNILISDFQNSNINNIQQLPTNTSFIQLQPQQKENLSVDSIFVNDIGTDNLEVNILIKNQGKAKKDIPIAIFNGEKLINKQLFSIEENTQKKVVFSVVKTDTFLGKITLNFNDTYSFDNSFYFSINTKSKIKVLNLGDNKSFINRIYTKNEFDLTTATTKNLNYNLIPKQHLIVLNEIENLTETLSNSLINFCKNGGDIIIIPHKNLSINSYNNLFKKLNIGNISSVKNDSLKITSINYKHPILKNVFEKNVTNFQYPFVTKSYNTALKNANTIVSFENKKPLIQQIKINNAAVYWVASPLNKSNSNFVNSPLVVPVFYNIGKQSLQLTKLYYTVTKKTIIDIDKQLSKNEIVTISNTNNSFIPLQQTLQNSVKITTDSQPLKAGIYEIKHQETNIQSIAYNYPKQESLLTFLDSSEENIKFSKSITNTLQNINDENKIQWLWKWFLVLAIVSLLIEILILKFFKS